MRKNRAEKREVLADPVYNDIIVTRMINKIMLDGKKSIAESVFYDAIDQIKENTDEEGIEVLKKGIRKYYASFRG